MVGYPLTPYLCDSGAFCVGAVSEAMVKKAISDHEGITAWSAAFTATTLTPIDFNFVAACLQSGASL